MQLHDVMDAAPAILAIYVTGGAILSGLYAAFSKLLDSSLNYPSNKYLSKLGALSKGVLKVLDIIGYHPPRQDVKRAIEKNEKDISDIKDQNGLL